MMVLVVGAGRVGSAVAKSSLAAEEPSRIRGGVGLGGKGGPLDNFVGDATKYVVRKAPCRVILTAPPSGKAAVDPMTPVAGDQPEHPVGHPLAAAGTGRPGR